MDKLYNWYLWYNDKENLWYAVPRSKIVEFHNGKLDPKEYIYATDTIKLIRYLSEHG